MLLVLASLLPTSVALADADAEDPEADLDPKTVADANAEQAPEPVPEVYSRRIVHRPIALPGGASEASLELGVIRTTDRSGNLRAPIEALPGAKIAFDHLELGGALELFLLDPTNPSSKPSERIHVGHGTLHYAPSPTFYFGAEFDVGRITSAKGSDDTLVLPTAVAAYRAIGPTVALDLVGRVGAAFLASHPADDVFACGAAMKLQLQLREHLVLEPRVEVVIIPSADSTGSAGIGVVTSSTDTFDVGARVELRPDETLYVVSIVARIVPPTATRGRLVATP